MRVCRHQNLNLTFIIQSSSTQFRPRYANVVSILIDRSIDRSIYHSPNNPKDKETKFSNLHIHTPVLSGFVPSLVGLVSSENEEQTQETRRESERVHRKGQNRSVLSTKHSGVNFTHKIRVLASKHVPEHGEGSNQRDNQNLTTDVL